MHDWVTLTTRLGETISQPDTTQLKQTLDELFSFEDYEHPDAWINCGSDTGPLYSISIFSSGYALYAKYSDADMTEELETKRIAPLDQASALALWCKLLADEVDEI